MPPLPAEIFKAYDIRGIVGPRFNVDIVHQIGLALAAEARERQQTCCAVGRDGRLSSPALSAALIEGLNRGGIDVIDLGMVPTPVSYFAAHHLGCHNCVAVTGSHNPPEYNGLKLVLAGETLGGPRIQALRQRIEAGALPEPGGGQCQNLDIAPAYLQRILGDVKLARPLRVALDCGNGVAGPLAQALFAGLGCTLLPLYCDIDGHFPHHHPDPSRPENLRALQAVLREGRADIGLAFDGDGDRLWVVAADGSVIYPDRLLMLFAADVLSRVPGGEVIYDVKSTRLLAPWLRQHGGRPLLWKTGHSLAKLKLKEVGAPLAGELSGHFIFGERWYGFDDGLYAGARLLEILARHPDPGALLAALPQAHSTPEIQIPLAEGESGNLVAQLLALPPLPGEVERFTLDGLRIDFADGFGLVRASNTTPMLTLRFEGDTPAALARIQALFRAQLAQLLPTRALGF
ncbi:MAG: Phosphomannomutase [Pseudomonadota bacterium]|jgi:phosphomannomutase/phosphoglucomutase